MAGGAANAAELARSRHKSAVELRSQRVMQSFFRFAPARTPPQTEEEQQDGLAIKRSRDQLLLPLGSSPSTRWAAYGAALMGASIVLAAHAPAALQPLFTAPVHFGPALLDHGGFGVAVGGRL
jgi:hypothetical protein